MQVHSTSCSEAPRQKPPKPAPEIFNLLSERAQRPVFETSRSDTQPWRPAPVTQTLSHSGAAPVTQTLSCEGAASVTQTLSCGRPAPVTQTLSCGGQPQSLRHSAVQTLSRGGQPQSLRHSAVEASPSHSDTQLCRHSAVEASPSHSDTQLWRPAPVTQTLSCGGQPQSLRHSADCLSV